MDNDSQENMTDDPQSTLKGIVKDYFSKKYLFQELSNSVVGNSGQKWNFDAIIKTDDAKFGVFIKDWNRSIGINQVRLLEKACIDCMFDGGLIIGNVFSSHAKSYGANKGVQVVLKGDIVRKVRGY
jgi:hypothetical protein